MRSSRSWLALTVAVLAAVIAACAGGAPAGSGTASEGAVAGPPQVVIQSPPANAQVALGEAVDVVATAVDAIGVGRIDLKVNDSTISSAETPPGGLTSFSAVHVWTPSTAGPTTLTVVAYRADGAPSEPVSIPVLVLPAGATAVPYPTFGGAVPQYRASAVPGNYAEPTYKANPSYGTNPTYGVDPTYGAEPTYGATPTYAVGATPTYRADPTYTAAPTDTASPTYTTAPTGSLAPIDGNFNFAVPFNGAKELSDYVSYPGGDVEDRIAYSVSGMSQTPPQNNAHLIVFATCEGGGAQYLVFKVGTQEFHCGDKIIDRDVTFDSNTGAIRVFFAAGAGTAYVKWTLNGSAFAP